MLFYKMLRPYQKDNFGHNCHISLLTFLLHDFELLLNIFSENSNRNVQDVRKGADNINCKSLLHYLLIIVSNKIVKPWK